MRDPLDKLAGPSPAEVSGETRTPAGRHFASRRFRKRFVSHVHGSCRDFDRARHPAGDAADELKK